MKQTPYLLLLLFSASTLSAQTDRGVFTGAVTDPIGKRIAGARLDIHSLATGVDRFTKSDGAGVYTVPSLATGSYEVTVSAEGFATTRFDDVRLDVGQTRTLDAKLAVATGSTQIQVREPDSALSRNSAEIGGVVHGSQAQDLPLNGRSYVGLVALTPGVINSGTGTQQDMRFAGLSDEDNNWHLDGIDDSGINHQYEKLDLHLQVSTEAIAEFSANGVAYSADQGGTAGGQIEVVSKSGGDQFHGSAWEFLRNDVFDAAPWDANSVVPPLRLNDFGGNFGGPILHKKLFFFANYEGLRQNIDQVLTGTVPSVAYRAQVAAAQPALAPLINAYPLGQVSISPTSDTWFGSGPQVTSENSGLSRVDYHINDQMSAFARFATDYYTQTEIDNLTPSTAFNNLDTPNVVIGLQNSFSPTILNDARFGFNRAAFLQGQNTPFDFALQISPFTTIDTPSGSIRNDNSFLFNDDATFLRGRHTVKAGVAIRRVQENKASPNFPDQTIEYTNPSTFLANQIDSDSYAGAVPVTGQRLTEYAGYILDQLKVTPTFNVNAGLRYEYFGVDHEELGRGVSVDPLNCPGVICPSSLPWYQPNTLDFEPRLSLTWSPTMSHGTFVVRAGFGIYDGIGQFGGLSAPISNLATKYTLNQTQVPGLSYPVNPSLGVASASSSPSGAPINRKDVSADEWTLSVQQEVAKDTIFQIAYFGTNISHAFSDWTLNGINPATGKRPYAGFSTIDYRGTFNHGTTEALQTSLQRSFQTGLLISANYEWSHSIDNGGIGGGEADIPQDLACLTCERSDSDQDIRSYFSASTVWRLPVGHGHLLLGNASGATDFVLGGWQLSGIASARTGLPLNVTISRSASALPDQLNQNQRPNRIPGVPLYPAQRTPLDWLNPAAFSVPANGTWGNLGRNAVRAPGVWQIDPSLQKRFPITERLGLDFRVDAFNVLNGAQYGPPATNWAPPSGGVSNPNNYGVITSSFNTNPTGTGTPRELQFGLKLEY